MVAGAPGIISGKYIFKVRGRRLRSLFEEAVRRPPGSTLPITTVGSVVFSGRATKTMVGLTRYSDHHALGSSALPRQKITFYTALLGALSDSAAEGVMAHELAHAWLNEHVGPEDSEAREAGADALAREWGFGPELDALDREADSVRRTEVNY